MSEETAVVAPVVTLETLSAADRKALLEKLKDPVWRICNLYSVVDKRGNVVPFRPSGPQMKIVRAVYLEKKRRIVILKARRMGFSTLIDIMLADAAYWGENIQASIVDLNQKDAADKLVKKSRFAIESMPVELQEKPEINNSSELSWRNKSSINAGKNARGGVNHWLHISEWGPIAHEDPKRSTEIKTGALPSADQGIIIIESTFKGGKGGHFYELLKWAQEVPDHLKTEKDYWFFFFPWYEDETCTLQGSQAAISPETNRYLDEKEVELGIKFTPGQRLFYHVTEKEQGIFMRREYPTTPEEAFQAPVEGSIYGDIISGLRAKRRLVPFEWDRSVPCFTSWDLGWDDSTSVWIFQVVGPEVRWIWHLKQRGATASEMAALLKETGIPIDRCYLPHDAENKAAATGISYKAALEKTGLDCVVVPRTANIWAGINALRNILKRSWINMLGCKSGVESLESYHTKDTSSGGTVQKEPVHDWSSHDADAARTAAEALELGLVKAGSKRVWKQDFDAMVEPGSPIDVSAVRRRLSGSGGGARSGFSL